MNEVPPDQGEADEVDDLYRRASAADSSRPSESVRRAVLDHAAQLAAQRARERAPVKIDFTRPAANQPWRRPAIFGTLAAAALAGFMIAPQFFSPRVSGTSESSTFEKMQRQAAPARTAEAPVTTSQEPANASQEPTNVPQSPPNAPPVPFPTRSAQANDQLARVQVDKRRDLKAGAPARAAGRVAPLPPESAADNAPAEAQSLANVTVTQAQRTADARRAQSIASSVSGLTAAQPPAAAPILSPRLPAPRPADLSAELRHAAESGDLPTLKAVLGTQSAVDARDDAGRTALMLATLHGRTGAVELLLASGADPNAADAQGTTPLRAAMAADQSVIAEALRRAGAR